MTKFVPLVLLALIGCATTTPNVVRKPAAEDPSQIKTAQNRSGDQIAVYIGDSAIQFWDAPAATFNVQSRNETKELAKLEKFLTGKASELGGPADGSSDLKLTSVLNRGTRTVVRYEQVIARHRSGAFNYALPVSGAGLVINLINNKINSISSSLAVPPSLGFAFKQPGFDTGDFSNNEFSVLLQYVRSSDKRQKIEDRIARLARETGISFDFKTVLSRDAATQRAELTAFLARLSPMATARVMIELAQRHRLSYVQREGHWMFLVENFFGLPVEFDMEIPERDGQPLKVRNLRERHQNVTINVFDQPAFPNPPSTSLVILNSEGAKAGNVNGAVTANLFQHTINYFKRNHGWLNYSGKDPNGQLNIYLNVAAPQVADNAAWIPDYNLIVVGPGGQVLKDPQTSYTILGHEFTHAITMSSSKLVYEGESGALNEHFSDIQGSYIAGAANGKNFTYEIGADNLNPGIAAPRELTIKLFIAALQLAGQKIDQNEIVKYSLDKAPARHLRYPQLSLTPSIADMDAAVKTFGANCQPSTDNDRCGVHLLSGIPNRAVSRIIDEVGPDRVRQMIFNTVVFRLNAHSTFKDYVRQMYEECLITKDLDRTKDCGVVLQAFNEVGITYPVAQLPPPVNNPGPPPKREDKPVPNRIEPAPSPTLDMCGWVRKEVSGNYSIVDNKYNAAIVLNIFPKHTQGNFQRVFAMQCACVSGQISQQPNPKGVWINYFTNVEDVMERPLSACQEIKASN